MNNKNNNQKLTALTNEFKATMNHAEEIFEQYMEAAIEQAVMEALDKMSDVDKMILVLGLMTGAVEDKVIFDLEKLLSGEEPLKEESKVESKASVEEESKDAPCSPDDFAEMFAALWAMRTNCIIYTLE